MDDAVRAVRDDLGARDWDGLRLRLHPYLHWQLPDGRVLRGRTNVLAELAKRPEAGEPARVELRDGQVYRWMLDGS
ncbi:hypothetical protein [Conexibacter sp. SYSU D00693]|uniref:hypothetical protein n=1 Tax=Conexibacter sp. SYSU D00693 TaxID=2812560 RepID=UPI00196A6AD6|nr:hypothetical protein [Conexibacter sp. SYSU D00693]